MSGSRALPAGSPDSPARSPLGAIQHHHEDAVAEPHRFHRFPSPFHHRNVAVVSTPPSSFRRPRPHHHRFVALVHQTKMLPPTGGPRHQSKPRPRHRCRLSTRALPGTEPPRAVAERREAVPPITSVDASKNQLHQELRVGKRILRLILDVPPLAGAPPPAKTEAPSHLHRPRTESRPCSRRR